MANPLQIGKRSVNLASTPVRGSRIRRDPPPVAKKEVEVDPEERDRQTVVLGILGFALALFVIFIGLQVSTGWSLSQYTLEL